MSKDELKNRKYVEFLRKLYNCRECYIRKLVLPGTGNLDAKIVFIGEAPSRKRTYHLTFGERSRTIFESILKAMKLSRERVWATNVVKCNIPFKSTGRIDNCRKYLVEELEIISPQCIILLGEVAKHAVTPLNLSYRTFYLNHPMYCVYNPANLPKVLENARQIAKIISSLAGE